MSNSGSEVTRTQNNNGGGVLIGRDSYGPITITQAVDAKTKALLEKTAKVAPDLARLLGKALRDGVISPSTTEALAMAAHNINADVAEALVFAGSRINHDVAESLSYSAQRINDEVAASFHSAARSLREEREKLEQLPYSIRSTVVDLGWNDDSEDSEDSAEAAPYSRTEASYPWKVRLKIFSYGLLLGFILLGLPPLYYMFATR
jgi:hypothetical protein